MRLKRTMVVLSGLILFPSIAVADARYEAVEALGELNGIALQCKYLDEVSRMKAAVVANAPKERSFGLAFDESTNRAFLSMIEKRDSCPGKAVFSERVDAGIGLLQHAFGKD